MQASAQVAFSFIQFQDSNTEKEETSIQAGFSQLQAHHGHTQRFVSTRF